MSGSSTPKPRVSNGPKSPLKKLPYPESTILPIYAPKEALKVLGIRGNIYCLITLNILDFRHDDNIRGKIQKYKYIKRCLGINPSQKRKLGMATRAHFEHFHRPPFPGCLSLLLALRSIYRKLPFHSRREIFTTIRTYDNRCVWLWYNQLDLFGNQVWKTATLVDSSWKVHLCLWRHWN
jgi:hypothetical protein